MKSNSQSRSPFLFWDQNSSRQTEGQCDCDGGDCACTLSDTITSFPHGLKTIDSQNTLARAYLSKAFPLDDKYSVCFGAFHRPILINTTAESVLGLFSSPKKLYEALDGWQGECGKQEIINAVNIMKQQNLLVDSDEQLLGLQQSSNVLSAWLHLTDRCNLRCDYCYLPHVHKDMTLEVGKMAIDAIFRSARIHEYKKIKIKYAGGEPLLQFSLIEKLHKYAFDISKASMIDLDAVILSNGTLLDSKKARAIKALGLRVAISLDGLDDFHNIQRPYTGGNGSFQDVERGIDIVTCEGIPVDISVTVSAKNIDGLPLLIKWILDKNLPFGLNYYRESDLVADLDALRLTEDKIIKGMLSVFRVIEMNLPKRSLLSSLVDRANLASPHLQTCGVGENYLVFDYKGQVSKCQMQMTKVIAGTNTIDPLLAIRNDTSGIINLSVEQKSECKSCEWKYWCTGGCSLATHRATGRYDLKSPNCRIYKALYPEAVRLEGLRLISLAKESFLL
jgi:uncharacterized protein